MKSLALILALALPSHAIKNPDTFVYASIGDLESLDPAWAYDTASHEVMNNIYEYLLAFDGTGVKPKDLTPRLASALPSVSKDGLTYTFPIRKGVKFHDGTPLTPEDVRYSLLRFMLYDRAGGPSSLLLEPLLGESSTRKDDKLIDGIYERASQAVTVKGDSVVLKLKYPFAPLLGLLTNFGAIVSKEWCVKNGEWDGRAETLAAMNNPKRESSALQKKTNGTGPFKLERLDEKTKETVLARNDQYWRGPAKLKRVIIKVVDEFATRKLMLQAGDADSIYTPQMYYPQVEGLEGVTLIDGLRMLERSPMLFFTFHINPVGNPSIGSGKLDGQGIPPDFFSDIDVRKAVAHSIDYDGYVKDILRGKGRQSGSFLPEGLLGYKEGKAYTFDLKKAEAHLRRAWGGQVWEKGFKFSLLFNTGSTPAQTICQMIKKNLESLNPKFRVDVRALQWSSFLEQNQNHKTPMYTGAWLADFPDPHNFAFPILHSAGYFPGKQKYKNPKVDALVDQAVSTMDLKKREALYHKLQDLYYEDVPNVVLADGARFRSQRSWVKGYVFNPIFPGAPYGDYYWNLSKEGK